MQLLIKDNYFCDFKNQTLYFVNTHFIVFEFIFNFALLIINVLLILDSIDNKNLLILRENCKICNEHNRCLNVIMRKILIEQKFISIFSINNVTLLFSNVNSLFLSLTRKTLFFK